MMWKEKDFSFPLDMNKLKRKHTSEKCYQSRRNVNYPYKSQHGQRDTTYVKFKHQIRNQQIFQALLLLMFKLPICILFT